jgi:hypothetical protein
MRPASARIPLLWPGRPRAPRILAREPDQGHGPHRVAARRGAQRHDTCGAREGQAHGNGNRDTRCQDAGPGKLSRTPHLIGPLAETGTGKITSTGRHQMHRNLTGLH